MGLPKDRASALRELIPSKISQDGVTAICTVGRQLALRLDRLIRLIEAPTEEGLPVLPGARGVITVTGTELLALTLASFPRDHRTISVSTSETPLSVNPSAYWTAVAVANNDNAKRLWYGSGTVAVNAGPFIPPGEQLILYVPPSETLYGIVDGASITVGVSSLIVPR